MLDNMSPRQRRSRREKSTQDLRIYARNNFAQSPEGFNFGKKCEYPGRYHDSLPEVGTAQQAEAYYPGVVIPRFLESERKRMTSRLIIRSVFS